MAEKQKKSQKLKSQNRFLDEFMKFLGRENFSLYGTTLVCACMKFVICTVHVFMYM